MRVLPLLLLTACAAAAAEPPPQEAPPPLPPWSPPQSASAPVHTPLKQTLLIKNAKIYTLAGRTIEKGYLVVKDDRIAEVGEGDKALAGATVIDAAGRVLTPGIIDTHSHLGVYAEPNVEAHQDGNEMSDPTTPDVWAEHAFWPQDPGLRRALAGGVTTIQVLPGSANLIGGRSFVAKLRPETSARAMRVANAPQGLKIACGENPKRVYGSEKKRTPMTRMGNVLGYRKEFQRALEYRRRWQKYERDLAAWQKRQTPDARPKKGAKADDPPDPPDRNFALETLALVLDGKILVHNHCYRADEMAIMLDLAKEFGFHIRSFHHALEAYKLAPRLAEEGVAVSTWADWWGFKIEAFDGVAENAAIVHAAGARAIIHSDSAGDIRHLNQEAAKALVAGRRAGLTLSDEDALTWVTKNPAWALGIDRDVGTLEAGKLADLVVWDGSPLSVYTRPTHVLIEGEVVFDRARPRPSDFELGLTAEVLR